MNSDHPSESLPSNSAAVEGAMPKEQDTSNVLFPIVGIAASAGGLEAFTQLLEHLPIDTGMAFVLIQHLDPSQKSLLTEILTKKTQMPVQEAEDGIIVEPNQVYTIPPNTKMTLERGVLRLISRKKILGRYMPADAFFSSLAAEQGNKAIGVVLSGSNADGSLGLGEIKAAGGITFAQNEVSAQFTEMPNNAIATGYVDFILPPSQIAEELAQIAHHPHVAGLTKPETIEPLSEIPEALPTIFALLHSATGVDFTHYKQTTINRRIARRMVLYKLEQMAAYVRYLQENPAEIYALYQEILIGVTSFFRDPEVYQGLKERVFPTITKGKSNDLPIRIWVPGCATGEEVYSIAICLLEFLENVIPKPAIQIFATDINETAIEKARLGIYKQSQLVNVSSEQLRRFFTSVEGGYKISKTIREQCVFARQNLIGEPPFSNLDLISCRNVLIYFESVLQKRVMQIFYYALKPTGFLMLGTSESTGEFSDLFPVVDRKYNIYSRKLVSVRPQLDFSTSNYPIARQDSHKQISEKSGEAVDLQKLADQIVLNLYAPVGVLINDRIDILQFRGDTSPYLRPAPGQPSFNLLKMARKGLLEELRTGILQAKRQNISVRKENLHIEGSEPNQKLNVEVIPFQADEGETYYFLVLFEDVSELAHQPSPVNPKKNIEQLDIAPEILRLREELVATKQELAATQEYLQLITHEHEAITQDLKVANEEILSSNEELQSTNEELQTAKEEIQATNEELYTTNQELHSRNLELHYVNNDLLNLISSVNIPIIILTSDLRIRRFTPVAQRLLNLIPTDIGRPLSDIRSTIDLPNLESLLQEVMDSLNVQELEVQDQQGYWYNLRIRPYRTTENKIDGVVMVFVDINALKHTAQQLEQARNYAEAIVETVPEPLLVLDSGLRVVTANQAFYRIFQVSSPEIEQQLIFELGKGEWNIPHLITCLEEIFLNKIHLQEFEITAVFDKIGYKVLLLNGCQILQEKNEPMVLLAIRDITQQRQLEAERSRLLSYEQSARLEAEASNLAKDEFLSILSHELRNPLHAILGWSQLLRKKNLEPEQIARGLEVLERSAKAQTQLIEDLLDISRITTGKLSLNNHLIDLQSVIEAALEVVRLSADAKNIQIQSHLQPAIGKVLGDVDRLQQVIWNLLSNAIKFTPPGGMVEISLERVDSQAQIRVSDTGIGIPSEFLPYVFERFRQADSSKTRVHEGLGLGLSIVRHLVELHGGTVQAESSGEGLGTTIIIQLPLSSTVKEPLLPSNSQREEDLAEFVESPVDHLPSLKDLHILVVDDEEDIRELLMTALVTYDAEVTTAASADEAIAILTTNPGMYNVLLSDIGMPDQDGFSLIQRVRSLDAKLGREIPAAALTGYVSDDEIQQVHLAGFQMHCAKPIELDQLVLMVANLAGRTANK
ncbi:chemotaxis protein CheB [Anabaena sp. PCC 7108]|uniref:chemotaxis protein CheB n=1 Tax=Anabaena sp. PCC 7108 TaxID=163908 RepID=UPI0003498206|nr:chemotaxis protein CheB [Anabaena sp. PCC 7108]